MLCIARMKFRSLIDRVFNATREPQVLCADDDPDVRALCAAALRRAGYAVDEAADGREAREKLDQKQYSAVLLDLAMPYLHGVTLLAMLAKEKPDVMRRIVVVTGVPDAALADVRPHVASVLRKPLTIEAVVHAVVECCANDETIVGSRKPAATDSTTAIR